MKVLSDAFLTDLRQRIDIIDVVSEYVSLRRTGRNFVGLCPFHNERTPSFSVSAERQFYHCFGCGAGGNVIQFIMDIEGLPFIDAVKVAATRAGLDVPLTTDADESRSPENTSRRQRIKEAHELATKWYSYILMNTGVGVQALAYLQGRGITRTTMVAFRIGYAPDEKQGVVQFLRKRGFERDLLIESGIALAYGAQLVDRFQGRVMIPIMDAQGSVVAFGGRGIAEGVKPKYLNSPETPVFHKSRMLFNQHRARKAIRSQGSAILMEGYMDVISAEQAGVQHVVASLGTAFSAEQAALLKRYTEKLVIAYDGDNAGVTAAKRALTEAASQGLDCRVLVLPDGTDPDEQIRQSGATVFLHHLSTSALTPVQFMIHDLRATSELNSVAGEQSFIRSVLSILSNRASPIEIETEIRQLSTEFQVSIDSLKEELARIAKTSTARPIRRIAENVLEGFASVPVAKAKGHVLAGQRILQAMLTDQKAVQFLLQAGVDELATPEQTALLALGYGMRTAQPQADVTVLVEGIEDTELRRLAIAVLMMDDAPAPTGEMLRDYLRTIDIEKTMVQWRVAIEEWKQAQLRGDAEAISVAKDRIDALTAQAQQLKSSSYQPQSG